MFRNRSQKFRVSDVLHGCTPGRIQSVGYMQVIPLVSELSEDRFVSPIDGEAEVSTEHDDDGDQRQNKGVFSEPLTPLLVGWE